MAEKELKIKVTTETDVKDVEDLEELLEKLQDTNVTVSVDTESTELEDVESRIEELEQKYSEMTTRVTELEDTVKQLGIKLSTEYESYVDKSFSDVDKIDELIGFIENGQATTVGEVIQAYKAK